MAFSQTMEVNKNKLCFEEVNNNENYYLAYKSICNLAYIDSNYIPDIFNLIKSDFEREEEQFNDEINHINDKEIYNFKKFLNYFETNYIKKYKISEWNYYPNIEHTTSNCCESYSNKLNNKFNKKPIFKLIYDFREEEDFIIKEHKRLVNGIYSIKKINCWKSR